MNEENMVETQDLPEASKKVTVDKQEVAVEGQNTKVPAKYFFVMNAQRLGEIFNNIAIIASVVALLMFLGVMALPIAMGVSYLIAIAAVALSLGLVLLKVKFSDLILIKSNNIGAFKELIWNITPYLLGVILALSVISLVCICFNRRKLSVARIITNVVIILFAVVGLIFASVQG